MLLQPLFGADLHKARQIGGYAKVAEDNPLRKPAGPATPVDQMPDDSQYQNGIWWNPMSEEAREYVGPMGCEPSALFSVDDSYPSSVHSEEDLWQLVLAMHKELKTIHYFEPGDVTASEKLKDWMKRLNTMRTLHVTKCNTCYENKPATAIVVQYGSDMKIFAAFRNPELVGQLSEKERRVLDSCAEWIAENIRKDMPNLMKIKKIHDAIVEGTTYTKPYHFTPELILDGIGVCSAYTTACQLLLHMVKIDCRYVHGDVATSSSETHAWNLVDVNGEWYHMDSTWDDPGDNLCYTYFLISDEEMDIDHDWPFKWEDDDTYPTTPEINKLNFYKRAYFEYKDGQKRAPEHYYSDSDDSFYEQLFGIMPEEDADKLQKWVPGVQLDRATKTVKPAENVVQVLTGRNKDEEKKPLGNKQGYEVTSSADFNKLIKQCAEKLEGPKISFTMSGGNTDQARNMVNASDIHEYVSAYTLTSDAEHPHAPDPRITLTVEYWPHVRLLSASRSLDAAAKLTPDEGAALHACRKLAETYGTNWKMRRQKIRDAYQYLTTRVQWKEEECPATDALLKATCDSMGYATTLHVICALMEIPSRMVFGRTDQALHMWNMIQWSGKRWYHADATMDAACGNLREHTWKYSRNCDVDQVEEHVWYVDEHPATPPGNPVKDKSKAREILRKLREKATEAAKCR